MSSAITAGMDEDQLDDLGYGPLDDENIDWDVAEEEE
jgi:hypothetical protein